MYFWKLKTLAAVQIVHFKFAYLQPKEFASHARASSSSRTRPQIDLHPTSQRDECVSQIHLCLRSRPHIELCSAVHVGVDLQSWWNWQNRLTCHQTKLKSFAFISLDNILPRLASVPYFSKNLGKASKIFQVILTRLASLLRSWQDHDHILTKLLCFYMHSHQSTMIMYDHDKAGYLCYKYIYGIK